MPGIDGKQAAGSSLTLCTVVCIGMWNDCFATPARRVSCCTLLKHRRCSQQSILFACLTFWHLKTGEGSCQLWGSCSGMAVPCCHEDCSSPGNTSPDRMLHVRTCLYTNKYFSNWSTHHRTEATPRTSSHCGRVLAFGQPTGTSR